MRRRIFFSGKLDNYLIYALGEIILIVVGILIAWSISDANEKRKNEQVQVKIYESFYEELNTNLTVLDSAIALYNEIATSLESTLGYVGLDPDNLDQEARDQIIKVKFRNTKLRNEALGSINSTDKFQFVESHDIAELLAQYPSEVKYYENQEVKIRNIVENRLKPILEKHISLIDMLPEQDGKYNKIRMFGQPSNYAGLLNSREYQNTIIDQLLQVQIQLSIAKNLRKKTETLALKLVQELQK